MAVGPGGRGEGLNTTHQVATNTWHYYSNCVMPYSSQLECPYKIIILLEALLLEHKKALRPWTVPKLGWP